MDDVKCQVVQGIDQPATYSDERFGIILAKSRELKGLSCELGDMANNKFDALLGPVPVNHTADSDKSAAQPSWADMVLDEQDETLRIIRNTLERLAMV